MHLQEVFSAIYYMNKYEYFVIDRNFKILEYSNGVFDYIDVNRYLCNNDDVREIVPEIYGLEDIILEIINREKKFFKLPFVEKDEKYINITIHPGKINSNKIETIIILFQDIKEYVDREKKSFQDRNERELLIEKINTQKIQLERFNKELHRMVEIELEKNRKKDQQLILQSRIAIIGEMISMIAHQWRQPLNIISLLTNDLRLELADNMNEKIDKCIFNVCSQVNYMSHTIDDFRNFFKKDKEKKEIALFEIFNFVINLLNPVFKEKNIDVYLNVDKNLHIVTFVHELQQVILNILNNAKDVLIDKKDNKAIKINVYQKRDDIIISIEDNGGGIKEEYLDKIFDPYFSTKSLNGSGLGLYISKIIIEKNLNGKLEVENTENGAKFIITLKGK